MAANTAWTEGPTLSAWIYGSPRGAAAGTVRLHRLSQRRAVVVVDAATVTWVRAAHRPRIGHPHLGSMPDAGRRSPLGVLLGRLLSLDEVAHDEAAHDEVAHGQAEAVDHVAEVADELRGTGLTEDFLRHLRDSFAPDTSALLVLSLAADFDEVQLVIERGKARGDVRLSHAPLSLDGLAVLAALPRMSTAVRDNEPACRRR